MLEQSHRRYPFIKCPFFSLTHCGRVTHICVSKLTTIGSDNGLSPGQRQAIIGTNAGILLIGTLGTNFEILSEIHTFSFKKMQLKTSSAKRRPFCLGLNVLSVRLVTCIIRYLLFVTWYVSLFDAMMTESKVFYTHLSTYWWSDTLRENQYVLWCHITTDLLLVCTAQTAYTSEFFKDITYLATKVVVLADWFIHRLHHRDVLRHPLSHIATFSKTWFLK